MVAKVLEIEHIDFPTNCYHEYSSNGKNFREYHIDCHDSLLRYVDENKKQYGGNLSVRRDGNKRPIMMIGQDESTYHQYIFSNRYWKGPNGSNFIVPKSSGDIVMISGFQSREFGLGLHKYLTPDIFNIINEKRKGKNYISTFDAEIVKGKSTKDDITDDPSLRFSTQELQRKDIGLVAT